MTLFAVLTETQQEYGIATNKIHAQGYDGAANMAGVHQGVQAIIRRSIPDAVYVHCKAQSLNLAIGHACKEPLVQNMIGTLQQIAFAFDYSAKCLLAFQDALSQDIITKEEMERRLKLRTLCETRWTSRADSFYTFHIAFPVVVQALQYLSEDGDSKARGYLCSIKQFDLIYNCTSRRRTCPGQYSCLVQYAPRKKHQPITNIEGSEGIDKCNHRRKK